MQRRVDEEVLRIIDEARSDVLSLIIKHRENLDALVSRLVEHETLDELDAYAAAGLPRAARPDLDQPPITIA